jgi:hypothetical protein
MTPNAISFSLLPKPLTILFVLYTFASLAHFVHNAEYIAIYPNMPSWITRETVYISWLVVACVGVVGLLAYRFKFPAIGALFIGAYGALGLDGLLHYTLALCGEHTLMTNMTIGLEVTLGFVLFLASSVLFYRHVQRALRR